MAIWDVTPKTVKGPDKATALQTAQRQLAVAKRAAAPLPPFLANTRKVWADDCSHADPVKAGLWNQYSIGRRDGRSAASKSVDELLPGRFEQHLDDGPNGLPYYSFFSPPGDNNWTDGTKGRNEIGYPIGSAGGVVPPHEGSPEVLYFYEGRRYVIIYAARFPKATWNIEAEGWRSISQFKANESAKPGVSGGPMASVEQHGGELMLAHDWGNPVERVRLVPDKWAYYAFDITFSGDPNKGRATLYADQDLDGVYEYATATFTGQTLSRNPGVEAVFYLGTYEGLGGDTRHSADHSIWA